ncbi:MAG: ABC transporter ATP-binding protein [Candidatus Methylomirabilales bacterium]
MAGDRMAGETLLTLDGLTKRYGSLVAVQDLSAEIRRGELVSFVGPSGCGKTTLLRLIGGFMQPEAGRILLEGRDVTPLPPNLRATAMVFQNYALFPHLTVGENIGYALTIRRRPRAEIARRVQELLSLVQLEGLADRRPVQLSGGQQQRVALARALSLRPQVLLLDEPLSNLDANLRIQMRAEITRLQRELRQTVVFVTHDQEEAMSLSDRIVVMDRGRILQTGTPREIYERPAAEFIARFVGAANFLDGVLGNGHREAAAVTTPLGTLRIQAAVNGHRAGTRVRLVLRPEAIRLEPASAASQGPNRVPGRIESATYTGAVIRYTVEAKGLRLAVDLSDPRHAPRFQAGDPVTLILPDDPHLLPAQ